MMQLLILKLEPEHALIVLLDLFHGQDLLILELSILSFEVSSQGNHFIELLVSLSFVAPGSHYLLLQDLYLLQVVTLLDLEELLLLL